MNLGTAAERGGLFPLPFTLLDLDSTPPTQTSESAPRLSACGALLAPCWHPHSVTLPRLP